MAEARIRRSRTTLLDQITAMESANLRDLLKVRDEDDASEAGAGAGTRGTGVVTLASILESEKHGGRTLLDVIREDDDAGGSGVAPPEMEREPVVRVSLMTLLTLTDGAGGEDAVASDAGDGGGSVGVMAVAEEEGGEAEEALTVAVADERIVCCVCMVRRKGAAFIPCGHTFCRVCSRELWTARGSCPLCNGLILDILDIF